jgi:carbamate kinase
VYEDFYSDSPKPRPKLTSAEARSLQAEGQFAPGSMAPKIEAAIDYLDAIDGEAIICLPEHLVEAIDGRMGTHITRA